MPAKNWLEQNGIDPDSVSPTLIALLDACDDPKCAEIITIALIETEPDPEAE